MAMLRAFAGEYAVNFAKNRLQIENMKTKHLTILLAFAAVVLVPRPIRGQVFDLSRDFSIAANPNGVWSYGWKGSISGAFTLLQHTRQGSPSEEASA